MGVGTLGEEGCTVGGGVVQIVAVPWEWYFGGTMGMGTLGEEDCTVGGGAVQVVAVPWGWYCGTAVVYGDGAVMLCSGVP